MGTGQKNSYKEIAEGGGSKGCGQESDRERRWAGTGSDGTHGRQQPGGQQRLCSNITPESLPPVPSTIPVSPQI